MIGLWSATLTPVCEPHLSLPEWLRFESWAMYPLTIRPSVSKLSRYQWKSEHWTSCNQTKWDPSPRWPGYWELSIIGHVTRHVFISVNICKPCLSLCQWNRFGIRDYQRRCWYVGQFGRNRTDINEHWDAVMYLLGENWITWRSFMNTEEAEELVNYYLAVRCSYRVQISRFIAGNFCSLSR